MDLFCKTGILTAGLALCAVLWLFSGSRHPRRTLRFLLFLGGGFSLYWLIISGLERCFLAEQLFRLFSCDDFPFRRPLCLSLCLVTAALLCMTGYGLRFFARLERFCRTVVGRWITVFCIAGLFFFWTTRITVISYLTADDPTILTAIASAVNGTISDVSNTFSHPLFCFAFSLLYRLAPDGYWYVGYHILAILGSLCIICFCILTRFLRRGTSVLYGIPVCFLTCFSVFLYGLARLSFTITPSLAGSAAVALMLCRRDFRRLLPADAIGCVLMVACILQRDDVWRCTACFWALAAAYQTVCTLLRDKEKKRSLICIGLCAVLCLGLPFGIHSIDPVAEDSEAESPYAEDYSTAEYYRSLVMDFLLDSLTDEDYAAAGIPDELKTVFHLWYFMDERICTDSFRRLAESYSERTGSLTVNLTDGDNISGVEPLGLMANFFREIASSQQTLSRAALTATLLLLCFALLLQDGKNGLPEFLVSLCAVAGALILSLYLYVNGRLILRAYLVAIQPCIVTLLFMILSAPGKTRPAHCRGLTVCVCLLSAAAAALCVFTALLTPSADVYSDRDSFFEGQRAYENYLSENSDIFVVETILTFENDQDPFHKLNYPDNSILWGYCGMTAEKDRLYSDCFFRDDVRFVPHSAAYLVALLQYLSVDYGPVQALQTQNISASIAAYDIDLISPGKDYTGWYEQNGYTYYFEDGHAVTGTRVIDGVTCEFAPAGAQSTFFTAFSDAGVVYSTDAYSLLPQE